MYNCMAYKVNALVHYTTTFTERKRKENFKVIVNELNSPSLLNIEDFAKLFVVVVVVLTF